MKQIVLFLLSFISLKLMAQKNEGGAYMGGVASFYSNSGSAYGGEFSGEFPVVKNLSIGAGIQALKFKEKEKIYAPGFISLRGVLPLKRFAIIAHVDPGYIYHDKEETSAIISQGVSSKKTTQYNGGFYFGTGLTFRTAGVGPYINAQYSIYQFNSKVITELSTANYKSKVNAFTITAGIWFGAVRNK